MVGWGNAIWAGLVATVVMTVLMYMGRAMGMKMDMPRMGEGKVLPPPGFFGKNYGGMIPFGIIMLHLVYGAIVGAIYSVPGAV